jgi:hypothetical protein
VRNQKSIITEWSRRSLFAISGKLKATLRHQRSNSGCGGNRQSVITSGAVGELERMRIEVPKRWMPLIAEPGRKSVMCVWSSFGQRLVHSPDPACEVKHRARAPELVYSRDVMRSEPCRKSVNPTVYGLASVNFCILLTLYLN